VIKKAVASGNWLLVNRKKAQQKNLPPSFVKKTGERRFRCAIFALYSAEF
jgi:hypothetical protein